MALGSQEHARRLSRSNLLLAAHYSLTAYHSLLTTSQGAARRLSLKDVVGVEEEANTEARAASRREPLLTTYYSARTALSPLAPSAARRAPRRASAITCSTSAPAG